MTSQSTDKHVASSREYDSTLVGEDVRLGLILTGSVFYGTVTFQKKNMFKILLVLPLKTKAKPNCSPQFLLLFPLNNPLCMQIIQLPLVFMGEH